MLFLGLGYLFDEPLGHVGVRDLDLLVAGAGVIKLVTGVRVSQVVPHARHVLRDLEASVLVRHHL